MQGHKSTKILIEYKFPLIHKLFKVINDLLGFFGFIIFWIYCQNFIAVSNCFQGIFLVFSLGILQEVIISKIIKTNNKSRTNKIKTIRKSKINNSNSSKNSNFRKKMLKEFLKL